MDINSDQGGGGGGGGGGHCNVAWLIIATAIRPILSLCMHDATIHKLHVFLYITYVSKESLDFVHLCTIILPCKFKQQNCLLFN